jgi:hypothetical protein
MNAQSQRLRCHRGPDEPHGGEREQGGGGSQLASRARHGATVSRPTDGPARAGARRRACLALTRSITLALSLALTIAALCSGCSAAPPSQVVSEPLRPATIGPPASAEPVTAPAPAWPMPVWVRADAIMHGERAVSLRNATTALRRIASNCFLMEVMAGDATERTFQAVATLGATGLVSAVSVAPEGDGLAACIAERIGALAFALPDGPDARVEVIIAPRPSALTLGRWPSLRAIPRPAPKQDRPRSPDEIAHAQGLAEMASAVGAVRDLDGATAAASAGRPPPLARLLAAHRSLEAQPALGLAHLMSALDRATALALEPPSAEAGASALYLLARLRSLSIQHDEACAALVALVCSGKPPTAPGPPRLAQDHTAAYWTAWESLHPYAASVDARGKGISTASTQDEPHSADEELRYVSPFEGCTGAPGASASMLADAWAQLGDHFRERMPPQAGPFHLNRAATAYRRSLQAVPDPMVRVHLAQTLLEQQRVHAAVEELVPLLASPKGPFGDPDALQSIAITLLGEALVEPDLQGPDADLPYRPRRSLRGTLSEWLYDDTIQIPTPASRRADALRRAEIAAVESAGLAHLNDPRLLPSGAWYAPLVLRASSAVYEGYARRATAVAVLDRALARYPLAPIAPRIQADLAARLERLSTLAIPGGLEARTLAARAADARASFASKFLEESSAWVTANRANAPARAAAGELARSLARAPAGGAE